MNEELDNVNSQIPTLAFGLSFTFIFLAITMKRICSRLILQVDIPAPPPPPLQIDMERVPLIWQYNNSQQVAIDVKESNDNKISGPQ